MNKNEMHDWIISFAKETIDGHRHEGFVPMDDKEMLRSTFTTYCLIFNIDPNTKESDIFFKELFDISNFGMNYNEWEVFMFKYLF